MPSGRATRGIRLAGKGVLVSLPRLDAVPSTAHGSREWSDAGAVRDACVWAVLSALVLGLAPIGVVSGDGLAQSLSYTLGTWRWNPNHLLLEPVGAWWQGMLTHLDVPLAPPDVLTRLSVVCGSLALGLALTIGVWHVRRREGRAAVGAAVAIGLGAVVVAGVGFLLAWAGAAPPGVGLLHWVRAYAGGGGAQRVAVEYGLSSLSGLP